MGGASAHALAFFGATFSEDALLAHNYTGAVHQWVPDENDQYLSCPPHTGHFARVTAVAWAPSGAFLLSCSADKTARVFAEGEEGFVEWARPQVHGHSIFAVAFCDPEGRRFVSGGEERMLRIFDAPSAFSVPGDAYTGSRSHVSAAVIPPLGLSNRPVCDADEVESGEEGAEKVDDTPWDADGPPLEEVLRQGRLWPEVAKLYGHGNEISCVAVDVTHGVLASACRAQTVRDAEIILWDVSSGTERARLAAHELTVCQMRFSDDTSALACVSKDRSLSVFRRQGDGRFDYRLALQRRGVHARLVHCCAWIGDGLIATGGRDKCIKVFSVRESDEESNGEEIFKRKFDSGVTALDCVWLSPNGKRVLAAGFDRGDIRLFLVSGGCGEEGLVVQSLLQCSEDMRCGGRVSSLQWRPSSVQKLGNITTIQLGIGSEDHSIRIYSFDLTASEEA